MKTEKQVRIALELLESDLLQISERIMKKAEEKGACEVCQLDSHKSELIGRITAIKWVLGEE